MRGALVRVGIDQSFGHWNAPMDPATCEFVYVPIPDNVEFHPGMATPYAALRDPLRRFSARRPDAYAGRLELPAALDWTSGLDARPSRSTDEHYVAHRGATAARVLLAAGHRSVCIDETWSEKWHDVQMAATSASGSPERRPRRVDFLGYGPARPESVFIGFEEYCPARAIETCHEVHRRFPARHDKNEAVKAYARACRDANLHKEATRFDAALDAGDVPTWRFAAMLLHTLNGERGTWEEEYQRLGTSGGTSFLCERFPLARPSRRHRLENEEDEARLERDHIDVLRRDVVPSLRSGTAIVSYVGTPAFLVGRMRRQGRRAWIAVASGVKVASTDRFAVLLVPFPRADDEYPWLHAAADAIRREMSRIIRDEHELLY